MRERDIEHLLLTGRMPPRRDEVSMQTRDELHTNAAIRAMPKLLERIAVALEALVEAQHNEYEAQRSAGLSEGET